MKRRMETADDVKMDMCRPLSLISYRRGVLGWTEGETGRRMETADDVKIVMCRPRPIAAYRGGDLGRTEEERERPPRLVSTEGAGAMVSNPAPLNEDGMVPYTSFSTVFDYQKEKALKEEWAMVDKALQLYGLCGNLDPYGGFISIATTPRTRGAGVVNKARDLLELLAFTRVPTSLALRVLGGSLHYKIIWIGQDNSGLCSTLSFESKGYYPQRRADIIRNLEGIAFACRCDIYFLGPCAVAFAKSPEPVLLARSILSKCIRRGCNPGTYVRLVNLYFERHGQTENLEMDAYGFRTTLAIKLIPSWLSAINNSKPSKSSVVYPTPEVDNLKTFLFGPSVNKDGMHVCGSFFQPKREKDVMEAWPGLRSYLEKNHGMSCAIYPAERFMVLSTTSRTQDPAIIHRAKDVLALLAATRIPPSEVLEVLDGCLQYRIMEIGDFNHGYCHRYKIDERTFMKRYRLLTSCIQELSELSSCRIYKNQLAVVAVGHNPVGLRMVKTLVKRCIILNAKPARFLQKVKSTRLRKKGESCAGVMDADPVENMVN